MSKGPPMAGVQLLVGSEALLVRDGLASLVERALAGAPAAFNRTDGPVTEMRALLDQARTPAMMGGRRVVVVRELENATADLLAPLLDYLENPSEGSVLILTGIKVPSTGGGKHDKGRKLKEVVARIGEVQVLDAGVERPEGFVRKRAQEAGVRLGPREATLLVEMVGRDLGRLALEVDKLVSFMGGQGTVTAEVVEEVCSLLAEAVIWDLTDAVVQRRPGAALGALHRLLEEGEAPHKVLAMLAWQFRQLLILQRCIYDGQNPKDHKVRIPPFKMDRIKAVLSRHPLRSEQVMETLARANQDMHGHRAGDRRVIEALVLALAGR